MELQTWQRVYDSSPPLKAITKHVGDNYDVITFSDCLFTGLVCIF